MYQCGFETFPFTEDSCAHSRTSFILLSLFNYAGFMAHTWFLSSSLAQHSWCELWAMPRRFLQTLRSTSRVTHWMHTWVAISSTYFIHPLFDCCCCYFICPFFLRTLHDKWDKQQMRVEIPIEAVSVDMCVRHPCKHFQWMMNICCYGGLHKK